jgi:hypothetical protein
MIRYSCARCGATMESPADLTGQVEQCPQCGHGNRVPAPKAPESPKAPAIDTAEGPVEKPTAPSLETVVPTGPANVRFAVLAATYLIAVFYGVPWTSLSGKVRHISTNEKEASEPAQKSVTAVTQPRSKPSLVPVRVTRGPVVDAPTRAPAATQPLRSAPRPSQPLYLLVARILLAVAIAVVLHVFWLNKMLAGRAWAIIAGYIAFLPVMSFLCIGLAGLMAALFSWAGPVGMAVAALIPFALSIVFLIANIMSPGLSEWLRVNGKCPNCRSWRFGRVSAKAGAELRCDRCGAHLSFVPGE